MKTSDIPDEPIIKFLASLGGRWATHFDSAGFDNMIPFPGGTPGKLRLSKMRSMLKRGLVVGCACGCRGDWRLP